jgi:hypothetical protein
MKNKMIFYLQDVFFHFQIQVLISLVHHQHQLQHFSFQFHYFQVFDDLFLVTNQINISLIIVFRKFSYSN